MPRTYMQWVSNSRRPLRLFRPVRGLVPADMAEIRESSALNAEVRSLSAVIAGPVHAERSIREGSVRIAAAQSRRERLLLSVINAGGFPMTRHIRRNSALSAAMCLMIMIKYKFRLDSLCALCWQEKIRNNKKIY